MAVQPRVISLFSGCGGLDWGFHEEGYKVVWANDIDAWAAKTFTRNFGSVMNLGDISTYDPYTDESIPEADLIIGGFPCQDFSVIWKQPGIDGSRGSLYKHFLRFVDAKKPLAFVAENVKGLLSANNRRAIQTIISDFESISPGYMVKVQLYNFAEYGVPQFRERVLIVGIRIDTGYEFVHPGPTHGPRGIFPYFTAGEALADIPPYAPNHELLGVKPRTVELLRRIPEGGNYTDIPVDDPLYVKGMISHVYRRIHRGEPAKTIIASGGGGTWGYHYPEPRPLTNRERARLQSFPDTFIFDGPVAEVRRQIGNAVPPQGVRSLARELKSLYEGAYTRVDLGYLNRGLRQLPILQRIRYDEVNRYRSDVAVEKTDR